MTTRNGRIGWLMLTIQLSISLLWPGQLMAGPTTQIVDVVGQRSVSGLGWLEYRQGLRVLHMQGTPYEMGYQHGVLLRRELARVGRLLNSSTNQREPWVARLWGFLVDVYHKTFVLSRLKRDVPGAYLEEMRGIAAGSGGVVDVDTLLMLQLLFETAVAEGCSLVALSEASIDGSVIHARNLDTSLADELADLITVMVYEPSQGEKFVSIGWPGLVGVVQGMNAAGMSVGHHRILLDRNTESAIATPGLLLTRESLQYATNPEEVLATFSGWPRGGGGAVVVATSGNRTGVIEYSPHRVAMRESVHGLLSVTDFFTSPALFPLSRTRWENNDGRCERLEHLLASVIGQLNVTTTVGILRDRQDPTTGRDGFFDIGINNMSTVTSTVFMPSQLQLWIARTDGFIQAPYHQYTFFDFLKGFEEARVDPTKDIAHSAWLNHPGATALSLVRRAYAHYLCDENEIMPERWTSAIPLLEQAVSLDSSAVPGYWLGQSYVKSNRLEEAIAVFQQVIHPAAHPFWRKAGLAGLGDAYRLQDKKQEATHFYYEALAVQVPKGSFFDEVEGINERARYGLSQIGLSIE